MYDILFKNPVSIRISSSFVDVFSNNRDIAFSITYLITIYEKKLSSSATPNKIYLFS